MKPASPGQAPARARTCPTCGQRFEDDALFCPNDGAPLATSPRAVSAERTDPYVGTELSGHIVLKALAGAGAMGRVYRAYQAGVERDVAVKILHRELSTNTQLVQRFHREAKVASRLSHPNVVHVYLAGQLADGALYIVMEYLDGLSLQSALAAEGGALDLSRALHIALQICDAVGEAHAQKVVHRDLKPENVMLVRRGADDEFVKVLDFGIARLNWGDESVATAAGLIFGTARYISPEGAQGETVGPPGDVYSVATLLYQMLSGRTPFEGEQAVALLVQQIHDPPPPLRSIPRAAYVPEPIANAVMKNLAKDPTARDQDAREFGRALLDAAKGAGLSADELVGMPLLGGRPSGGVKLSPMQRTKQLQLDAGTQQRLADASGALAPVAATAEAAVPGVDATLDDMDAPPPPALPPAPASSVARTELGAPLASALQDPPVRIAPAQRTQAFTESESPSSTGEPSEPEPAPARRLGARAVAIFVLCFLVGLGGATLIAYKLDFVGPGSGGDRPVGGSHAGQLDPKNTTTNDLVGPNGIQLDAGAAASRSVGTYAPPLPTLHQPPTGTGTGPTVANGVRATLDLVPGAPRIGQAVQLVAKVTTGTALKAPPAGATFDIATPTAQIIHLPASADASGTCTAQFTFFEPGRFVVTFFAQAEGKPVQAVRTIAVSVSPAPPPSGTDAPPLPSATGKWM